MKVIALGGNYAATSSNNNQLPATYLMADSSLQKSGKPLFLPDWADEFTAHAHLVIRVGRLGKNIARRFAHRYIDAATVGFTIEAHGEGISADSPEAKAFDGAALLGDFVELDTIPDIDDVKISTFNLGNEIFSFSSADMMRKADEIVEHLSKFFTLKIGDLIYTGFADKATAIHIDDRLTATLNGEEVLNIKIK